MDRVSVNPGKIRCLGNIVSPKTSTDFGTVNGTISSGTDSVNTQSMTVYTTDYLVGSKLSLSVPDNISQGDFSFTVTATLKDNTDTVVSGATVYCSVNDGAVTEATTNNSGVATFAVDVTGEDEYNIRCYYNGTQSLAGCTAYTRLPGVFAENIEILGSDVLTVDDENIIDLYGRITEAVPGKTVKFYLGDGLLQPDISLTGPSSVNVGTTVTLNGVLSIGSGKSVKLYQDGVLLDTLTTSTGGAFTKSITDLDTGNYSY